MTFFRNTWFVGSGMSDAPRRAFAGYGHRAAPQWWLEPPSVKGIYGWCFFLCAQTFSFLWPMHGVLLWEIVFCWNLGFRTLLLQSNLTQRLRQLMLMLTVIFYMFKLVNILGTFICKGSRQRLEVWQMFIKCLSVPPFWTNLRNSVCHEFFSTKLA